MTFGNYTVDYEQRSYNPERMRKERVDRAQAMLDKYGFGAMIAYNYENQRYLGYFGPRQFARRRPGVFVLLIKGAGLPYVPAVSNPAEAEMMPWFEGKMKLRTSKQLAMQQAYPSKLEYIQEEWDATAREIKWLLSEHGVADLPCGVDITNFNMIAACQRAGLNICDGNHIMTMARIMKTKDEIECLRMAGVIAESAHWEVAKALRPGVTEWEMAGVAANALFKLGAEEMEGPSFVICSGERSGRGIPAMPTDRIVRPGDMFVIDINGVSFQGYRTCFYRTYVVGDKPTEFQKEVYNCAYEGLVAMTECMKPGVTNHEIQEQWLEKGKAPGLWGSSPTFPEPGRYYLGSGAHHIGLVSGDPGPMVPGTVGLLNPNSPPLTLEKDMCFAVEVGCYTWDGKRWADDGAKIEHCGVVTEDGFEVFYKFPKKDLIACGLPGRY